MRKVKINKKIILLLLIIIILLLIYFLYIKGIEKFTNINDNNNTKLILKTPSYSSGFFSIFNMLLASLIDNPNTTEIEYNIISNKDNPSSYYVNESEELFTKIFQSYQSSPSNKIVEINQFIPDTDGTKLYFKGLDLYNDNRYKLKPFNDVYTKYIIIEPHIKERIENHIKILKNGDYNQYIGILVRSEAIGHKYDRNKYLDIINNQSKNLKTKYFFCIDNEEDLQFYKTKLNPHYYININRSLTNKGDAPHTNNNLKTLDEFENVFIQVAVLSSCDILVHCSSNMATASLIMNMEQKSVCIDTL